MLVPPLLSLSGKSGPSRVLDLCGHGMDPDHPARLQRIERGKRLAIQRVSRRRTTLPEPFDLFCGPSFAVRFLAIPKGEQDLSMIDDHRARAGVLAVSKVALRFP